MKKTITLAFLALFLLGLCAGCGQKAPVRSAQEIIEEMVVDYGSYGEKADEHIRGLLKELSSVDKDIAARWESIMALWKSSNAALDVNYDEPPAGLPDSGRY